MRYEHQPHITEGVNCWCSPSFFMPCDECDAGCWKCDGGKIAIGYTLAATLDAADSGGLVIVHNYNALRVVPIGEPAPAAVLTITPEGKVL